MKHYGLVYKYTDLTNRKIYYGQTINLKKRQAQHLSLAKNGDESYLHRAMRAHGIENFICEVIEKCDNEDQLNKREQFYIARDKSNSPKFGYNMTEGGGGKSGYHHSQETKDKIRKKKIGKKMSIEFCKKRSELTSGKNNPMFGRHHSEKAKRTISLNSSNYCKRTNTEKFLGRIWINNGSNNKIIKKEDLDQFIKCGFIKGRIKL